MKNFIGLLVVLLLISSTALTAYAHSGRTDSSGGHKDNKNASGLGSYHYHCGGNPPHLHSNGVCPYRSASTSRSNSSSSSSSSSSSTKSASREENVVHFRDIAGSSSSQVSSGTPTVAEYNEEEAEKNCAEIKERFQLFFDNDMIIISIGHLSEKNASVTVAYKAELPELDAAALVFYNYDKDANSYSKIEAPNYTYVDGTLTFTTSTNKGFVIITDKELTPKK